MILYGSFLYKPSLLSLLLRYNITKRFINPILLYNSRKTPDKMARQDNKEQDRKEQREVALINLKGNLPILYFCQLMQTEGMPFGQTGLSLSHDLFMKYLDNEDMQKDIIGSLKKSEIQAMRQGAGLYGGQVSSKGLITGGSAVISESIDRVYVSDIADILGIKCLKYHETFIGDLNERDASKEEKELYKRIIIAYQSHNIHTHMSEATEENSKAASGSLEELLVNENKIVDLSQYRHRRALAA